MRVNFCTLDERACVCVCVRGNRERAQIKRITDTNDYNTELLLPIFFFDVVAVVVVVVVRSFVVFVIFSKLFLHKHNLVWLFYI